MKKLILLPFLLVACGAELSNGEITSSEVKSVYWSDGDSGRISLKSGDVIKFRIDDWDAPETGGVGAAIGGAKCEAEREQGFLAKEFMVENTKYITRWEHSNEYDRYERLLAKPFINDDELAERASESDFLRSWKHDGRKALEARPKWCEEN